ncbi:MAG: acyl-CoA thioesterase [Streptosporangiales bacterium]|nr:acyl-CoA thioesterase [Streptosporangiales bacterium]
MPAAAEIACEHRVEWYDTDAAGHHHHSAILRWVEAAEAELLRGYGLDGLFGRTPRVRYEADYRARLVFGQPVRVGLRVAELGRTSLRYEFEVLTADGTIAAAGVMVVAYVPTLESAAMPWPEEVRAVLGPAGRAHRRSRGS